MDQVCYDLMLPEDDDVQGRIEEVGKQFQAYLVDFDFNALDELTTDDFLGWFYDQDGYQDEFVNLATRSHYWKSTQALDVATDYADYLIMKGDL